MTRVLVIDDDMAIRETVAMTLEKIGFSVLRAGDLPAARKILSAVRPDLIVCDIYMPGGDGLSLLKEVQDQTDPPPVILMTAKGSIETAAQAVKGGVFDYLAKPFDLPVLLERVRAALSLRKPSGSAEEAGPQSMIIGSHPAIVAVYMAVARVAALRIPVLVFGETGTGKELVARALHKFSAHPDGPFIPVHCGAIPDSLLESELFGHRRGAFTDAQRDRRGALAQAHGGTVFLDEIGEISATFQVKLLRFLEDGVVLPLGAEKGEVVAVRVVAATHRDLRAMVADGRFRQDLFFRLAGYEIQIPALRERLSDLPVLVEHFQRRSERELALGATRGPSPHVMARLSRHFWPGNVRELGHVIRRALINVGSLEDLPAIQRLLESPGEKRPFVQWPVGSDGQFLPLDEIERLYIATVLDATGGNKTEAARILGVERKMIARRSKRGDVPEPEDVDGGDSCSDSC